jgi:hypothetical protein
MNDYNDRRNDIEDSIMKEAREIETYIERMKA